MATHYVELDRIRSSRKSVAACGEYVWAHREHSNDPTCPECARFVRELQADTRTAEDVFGSTSPGTPVHHKPFNPLAGYRPKET